MDLSPLHTHRLVLRPLEPSDAPQIAELAVDREIARNTESIPHPYTEDDARDFIARALVQWGFAETGFHRIYAEAFSRNPASRRVLEKIGMTHEGTLRRHYEKWGEKLDLEIYGLLRDEATRR